MSNPKQFTFGGRLSFPSFTAAESFELSKRGSYPLSDPAAAAPHFQVLLNDTQWKKFKAHCIDFFLPYCAAQHKAGEKKDALDPKEIKALIEVLEAEGNGPYNTPIKPINEKTQVLAPECLVAVKVIGTKGGVIEQSAIVTKESELAVPDPDILSYPLIKPIGQTVHTLYPGCNVVVTGSLYAFHNGKLAGFSCGGSAVVFRSDNERFGGGSTIDEAAVFLVD